MPFGGLGIWEILLILVVLLLVFGAKRLPELGGALGKGIREFKGSIREIETEFTQSTAEAPKRELNAPTQQGAPTAQDAAAKTEPKQQ